MLRRSEALLGFREHRLRLADKLPEAIRQIAVEIQYGATTNDLVELIDDQRGIGRMPHESDLKYAESSLRDILGEIKVALNELN